jgi:hypothetical protein
MTFSLTYNAPSFSIEIIEMARGSDASQANKKIKIIINDSITDGFGT